MAVAESISYIFKRIIIQNLIIYYEFYYTPMDHAGFRQPGKIWKQS